MLLCKCCLWMGVKLVVKCFSICFHFQKQDAYWLWHKYCKIKLFSGTIFHGASSNEPEVYLEPSQTYTREWFCKNSKQLQLFSQKSSIIDVWLGFQYALVNINLEKVKNTVYWKLMKFLRFYLKKNKILSVCVKDKSCNSPEGLQLY